MPFIADLHVHSYLSRATSRELDLEHLRVRATQGDRGRGDWGGAPIRAGWPSCATSWFRRALACFGCATTWPAPSTKRPWGLPGRCACGPIWRCCERRPVPPGAAARAQPREQSLCGGASIPCQRSGSDALTSRPHVADLLSRLPGAVRRNASKPLSDVLAGLDPEAKLDPRRQQAVELLCTLALPFGRDLPAFLESIAFGATPTSPQYRRRCRYGLCTPRRAWNSRWS